MLRLGVSVIYPLYIEGEEWTDNKLHNKKIKYITSNTKNL